MSGYEARPGDVTLYKEKDKKSDKAPDWKGFALVTVPDTAKPGETVRMEIAVWNKGQYGTMLGGKISEPRMRDGQDGGFPVRQQEPAKPSAFALDDDIPF